MEADDVKQTILADSHDEEQLIRRLLRAKDELLRLTPGFREDAEAFLAQLLPHEGAVNLVHNDDIATSFAKKWALPFEPILRDSSYLASSPFSGAPVVDGSAWAVGAPWFVPDRKDEGRPFLVLTIDVRYPKSYLLDRVDERIGWAQLAWGAARGTSWSHPKKDLAKLERMLEVHAMRTKGMTQEKVAERLQISPRQVVRIQNDLTRMLEDRGYLTIAPYTLFSWNILTAPTTRPDSSEA